MTPSPQTDIAIAPGSTDSEPDAPMPLIFLGDSHTAYFEHCNRHHLFAPRGFSCRSVGGATAVGMRNPNSQTNAVQTYREFVKNKPRHAIITIHLGEVDCGFAIWHHAERHGQSIQDQMERSIAAYFEFVDELLAQGFAHVVLTGATLPTITDSDQIGEVVVLRSKIKATQLERTELTLEYNRCVQREASARGLRYTDISADVLDPRTGVADPRFRNANPHDHHMRNDLAGITWARKLIPIFDALDPIAAEPKKWQSVKSTFAKALFVHSASLADDWKLTIPKGAVLEGILAKDAGAAYCILRPVVDGTAIDPNLRIFHADAWRQVQAA